MPQKSITKNAPQSFDDLVFANKAAQNSVAAYKSTSNPDNLLLFGPKGTGKTSIAKMLPYLVEPKASASDITFYDCHLNKLITDIEPKISTPMKAWPNGDRRYLIMDEIDGLNKDTQKAMRTTMDQLSGHVLFIATTNYKDQLEVAMVDRFNQVEMRMPPPEAWLPRAREIVSAGTSKNVPDEQLLDVLRLHQSSGRNVIRGCENLIARINSSHRTSTCVPATPKEIMK